MQTKNRGYLPIDRGLFEHPFWCEERCYSRFEAWLYLLKEARFEDTKLYLSNRVFIVKRGQISVSLRYLAQAWDWSTKRVKSYLELLKSDSMIVVEMPKETGQTLITICKYDCYNKPLAAKETVGKQQGNGKETNIKKDKIIINKENTPPNPLKGERASSFNNFDSSSKNTTPTTSPTAPEEDKEKSCAKKEKSINYQLVVDIFCRRCPSAPRPEGLTRTRRANIDVRVKQMGSPETMYRVFDKMEASDFLSGRSGRRIGSFNWLFSPTKKGEEDNWRKVLEGNYDNVAKPATAVSSPVDDKKLEAQRVALRQQKIDHAVKELTARGLSVSDCGNGLLLFYFEGEPCSYHAVENGFSGETIGNGRGLENLLELLK